MKQTNNAIKFLMAQYRAIFRNANLKMFLAAATAAAAMAAGQAQAASPLNAEGVWTALEGDKTAGTDQSDYTKIEIQDADTSKYDNTNKEFTLTIVGGENTIAGSADQAVVKAASGTVILNGSEASLKIGGVQSKSGATVTLKDFKALAGSLTIGGSDQKSALEADTIIIQGAQEEQAAKDSTPAVAVKLGKSGSLGGTNSAITLGTGAALTIESQATDTSIKGKNLAVDGGIVTVDAGQSLVISSTESVDVKALSDFTNKGTVKFDQAKTITFAKDTLKNTGTIELGELSNTRSTHLKVDAAQFASLFKDNAKLSVSGAAGGAGTLTIEATGTDAIDLKESTLFADTGKIDTTNALASGGTATNINVNIKADSATLGIDIIAESGIGNVGLEFNTFNVGNGSADFTVTGKNTLTIKNELAVSGDHGIVFDSGAGLSLSGSTGSVTAKSITIGSDAASGAFNVKSGNWNTKGLIIKSGTATVTGSSTLVLSGGDVSTKDENGKLVVESQATVDLVGASKVTLGAKGTELKTGGKLILDQAKSFDIAEADVTLKTAGDSTFLENSVSGDKSSILQFNSETEQTISVAAAGKLKEKITTFEGFLQFGGKLAIDNSNEKDAEKEWNDISGSATIMGANDKVTLKADEVSSIAAVGNVKLSTASDKEFEVKDTALYLTNAGANQAGKFVMDSTGATADLKLSGDASVGFTSEGEVGKITSDADKGTVLIGNANSTGTVTVKGGVGVSDNKVNKVSVTSGSTLKLDGKADEGLFVNQLTLAEGSTLNATGHEVVLGSGALASSINGDLTADKLTLNGSGKHTIAGNAEVKVTELTLEKAASKLYVGQDGANGSTGILEVDKLSLNSGSLIIDPDFDKGLAIAYVKAFNAQAKSPEGGKDAQIVNGDIIVGKNSVAAIGFETRDDVMSLLDSYGYLKTHENGTINLDSGEGIQAALVLDDPIKIASGNGVLIDPSKKGSELSAASGNVGDKFKMDGQGALIINDSVYVRGTDGQLKGAAVTLADGADGAVEVNGKSKAILAGAFSKADKGIQVFKTEKNGGVTKLVNSPFTIETANGIFTAQVDASGTVSEFEFMAGAEEKFKSFYKQSSAPVEQLLKNTFLGELAVDRNYAGANLVLAAANDKDDHTGVKADAAAHAATYAGAQIAAVAAVGSMADAVGGRVGAAGVESAVVAATGSQANGGVWLSPMYKSVDADGFNAQGASYGADVDLAGVAFGTDTVNGNMRFGAVFNIGSGDADGKGNGNGLKDEFDYYGFGMYTVMGFGNFALVGDASLNVISHDVSGESGLKGFGKLKGSADTTAVTMGVTGQYTISNPAVDVTPHVGARFIRLDTDSYDLVSDKGTVATTDYDVQNVFSIPLGVTLSKAFEMGGWSLAPSADLTLTFNTGDTEVNSNTKFTGVNRNLGLTTEVLDEVTYGVAVGLGAQYGAFGTNIGINYTGSSNTDAFGVNAQARYMF